MTVFTRPRLPCWLSIAHWLADRRKRRTLHLQLTIVAIAIFNSLVAVDEVLRAADETKPAAPRTVKEKEFEADGSLPKYQDLQIPSAEELLKSKPFDWVVLKTQDVLIVEPVSPRPETLVRLGTDYERYLKARSGFVEGEERLKEKRRLLQRLQVTLVDPGEEEDADYLVETKFIQRIEYYEDLVLRRASDLIEQGTVPLAYDLLLLVDRRHRENNLRLKELYEARQQEEAAAKTAENERLRYSVPEPLSLKLSKSWPRFDEVFQNLLFKDAQLHSERGDDESALRILENLWDHNASYRGLSDRLGEVIDRLVQPQVEQSDFRQARFFLGRLTTRDAQHPIAGKWRDDLIARTGAVVDAAKTASADGNAADAAKLINQAARIWPETPGLKEIHRELVNRHQSVRIGVLRLPGESSRYPFELTADAESRLMTNQTLFEPTRVDERRVHYRSPVFESWEPTDLGRQVQFTLRMKRADWESRPVMTSADILSELLARLNPKHPSYDERLAGVVNEVVIESPTQLTIHFRQLPLRLESLLQFTVPLDEGSLSLNSDLQTQAIPTAGRQRFIEFQRDASQVAYRRVRLQPVSLKSRNVDEVVEVRYDSWDRALQAMLRGDITCVPHAGLKDVKEVQEDNRFLVMPYALPISHFLLFNPESEPLKDGQLRRALSLALPREDLLNGSILKDCNSSYARISATLFPTTSYGNNRLLSEPPYDPQRAATLALTARKQLKGELPELRMICPPDPILRSVARQMIEHWKRIGVTVHLVDETDDVSGGHWDLVYRTTTIVEPVAELWPILALQPDAKIESLKPLPERVRHQLLDLERSNDWTNATRLLRRIASELLIESRYIPLWEVDDFFVTRRHLVGMPSRLMHPFQDIERWTLMSWYPQDPM